MHRGLPMVIWATHPTSREVLNDGKAAVFSY
jgi:hypothetical protein